MFTIGMYQSLGQSCSLNVQDFLASLSHLCIRRDEGMSINSTGERKGMIAKSSLRLNDLGLCMTLGIDECRVGMAFGA